MDERLKKQFDFIKEIDKEKFIQRQTLLTGGERKENDAEHAWHMALMTVLLSEYANEKNRCFKNGYNAFTARYCGD